MGILGMRRNVAFFAFALTVGASIHPASAEYPERPVTLVVSYGAGGLTDVVTRSAMQAAQRAFPEPIVVTNRPGAQATLGSALVAKARPDGYTLNVVTTSAIAIAPHLMAVPYTPEDFEYIGGFARNSHFGLAVRADAPYRTLEEFIAHGRRLGKPVLFGAGGAPNNLAFFALGRAAGVTFEQISYKGGLESVNALLGGQIEAVIQARSEVLPHIQSGKLRLLAAAGSMRWKGQDDIPTLKELGYNIELDAWIGLLAPLETPAFVREHWKKAMTNALKSPAVEAQFEGFGVEPIWMNGEEFRRVLQGAHKTMGAELKAVGLKTTP